jgi:DHA2 family methylenomycin A resistance protein-like MFS transporter
MLALVAICTGYFMTILDTTVVNVALPRIQMRFNVSVAGLQWIVDGYALAFASLLLTGGGLGDRIGNRRIFLTGVAIFTAASALCGAAPDLRSLQIARVSQGAGAALLLPTSLALLSNVFPEERQQAHALGIWGGIAGIGAVAGPVIGGFLVNVFSWRSIFLINLPFGMLGIVLTLLAVDSRDERSSRELDIAAQLAAVIALGMLIFACIESGTSGWRSPRIVGALAVCAIAAIVFLAIEYRARNPMLPLPLFKHRHFLLEAW